MDIAINPTTEITPDFINEILKTVSDFLDLAEKLALITIFSKKDDELVANAKMVFAWVKENIVTKPWFASVLEFVMKFLAKKEVA